MRMKYCEMRVHVYRILIIIIYTSVIPRRSPTSVTYGMPHARKKVHGHIKNFGCFDAQLLMYNNYIHRYTLISTTVYYIYIIAETMSKTMGCWVSI